MALNDKALFLYGFDVTPYNRYINFKNQSLGPELLATLNLGNYTATEFIAEVKRALEAADGVYTYTITIDRTVASGQSNLLHISSSAPFFSLLFLTGSSAANSPASIMGFQNLDYTGATAYVSYKNCGVILFPDFPTYDYLGPGEMVENDGSRNVSAYGVKETLVFAQFYFFQGQWQYITNFNGNTQKTQFEAFLQYATKQRKFEFTPSVYEDPTTFYQCTLESAAGYSSGMGYVLKQMRGQGLYRFYDTGVLKFRVNPIL